MSKYVVFLNYTQFTFDSLQDAEQFADLAVRGYAPDFEKAASDEINLTLVYEEVDGSTIEKVRKKVYVREDASAERSDE